ncbi:flagellar FlbD family protein [Halonatronum saccharophilum]|uniref:flagellar FlbD family protein n=1 Tax=Halonatronum saccharophilum TaxID=150060 RepID=UPI0004B3F020|nr:flagellar FlbD family protein [Halonatronum saccharophilum]
MVAIIKVTRFNGPEFVVNADLIETIEATPDTVIQLTSKRRLVVQEDVEEVIRKVIEYKKNIGFNLE